MRGGSSEESAGRGREGRRDAGVLAWLGFGRQQPGTSERGRTKGVSERVWLYIR